MLLSQTIGSQHFLGQPEEQRQIEHRCCPGALVPGQSSISLAQGRCQSSQGPELVGGVEVLPVACLSALIGHLAGTSPL